jgi:lysophospholipase L1-like esterase
VVVRLFALAVISAAVVAAGTAGAAGSPKILFVGDSIAAGWYATSPSDAFPAKVAKQMNARSVVIAKAGVRAGFYAARRFPAADDVVIELGTNDWAKGTPVAVFATRYSQVVRHIMAASPKAHLVCLSVWPKGRNIAPYNDAIRATCAAGTYVSLGAIYARKASRGPVGRQTFLGVGDDYHPNDAGHSMIARAIEHALS